MSLPLKALQLEQLTVLNEKINPSGNEVLKVTFINAAGKQKLGFYKPISPYYPSELAKFVVAYSVRMRLALGGRVDENRLVLNQSGEIVGTVSVAIPGFKPFASIGEKLPENPQERELVCPSVRTIMERNLTAILVSLRIHKEDDAHGKNNSACGKDEDDIYAEEGVTIDRDMTGYPETFNYKQRWVHGTLMPLPKKAMFLKVTEWSNFPIVERDVLTHWPTHYIPGNLNVTKQYQAVESFRALQANPIIITEQGYISFQEQMFSALLKELLVFNPPMLQSRLKDYLGDETEEQKKFLSELMTIFQTEYDEICRSVLFFRGCEKNNSGVPVASFYDFLQSKPSALRKIFAWAEKQNELMEDSWQQHGESAQEKLHLLNEKIKAKTAQKKDFAQLIIVNSTCVAESGRYDLNIIMQRYQKIWRDVHAPMLGTILEESRLFVNKFGKLKESLLPLKKEGALSPSDFNFKEAKMLFGELINTQLAATEYGVFKFIQSLHRLTASYYQTDLLELSPQINSDFAKNLAQIFSECTQELESGDSRLSEEFSPIAAAIKKLLAGLLIWNHWQSKDKTLIADPQPVCIVKRCHTSDEVIATCLHALFTWVDNIEQEVLNTLVIGVIEERYKPAIFNPLANRNREHFVKKYLKNTLKEKNSERLAYILCDGMCESTSLNTCLIQVLIEQMLNSSSPVDVSLSSIREAYNLNQFNAQLYAKCAKDFAIANNDSHLYTTKRMEEFNRLMFSWVETLDSQQFAAYVVMALKKYKPYTLNFLSNKNRATEVSECLSTDQTNIKKLTVIFAKGGNDSTSLNTHLFKILLLNLQQYISTIKEMAPYMHFLKIKKNDSHYLNSLQMYAKKISEELSTQELSFMV